MKISFKIDKKNFLMLFIAEVLAIALLFWSDYKTWTLLPFGAAFFLVTCVNIEFNKIGSWISTAVLIPAGAWFTAHMVQYLILDAELRAKTSDKKMLLNVLCCMVVYLAVQCFTNNIGITSKIANGFLMLMAGIDYFVYKFRGSEFIFSDLKSLKTGLSVAANYTYTMDDRAVYTIMLVAVYFVLMGWFETKCSNRILLTVLYLSLIVGTSVYIGTESTDFNTESWQQKGSYRNGYILNYVLSIRDSFVSAPDAYSEEVISELEKEYSGDGSDYIDNCAENLEQDVTIIAIMSESYADLTKIGDFTTNIEVTPFYNSLSENIIKGYALSSVFGAKTPNSEWEFMTGNSMAFLPQGSVVYQQYISDTPTSIVSNLKNEGYTCVAMHPYYSTGWSRNTVYPNMGFDETHFIDDFDQDEILREYITDKEFYSKIIERYETKKSSEDLFIMGVSMQNHGGYTEHYDNFTEEVKINGLYYSDANQYLSLLHESDEALEYLISYFENVDDPVEIIFFGDHQPSLSDSFYPNLNGSGLSGLTKDQLEDLYTVPFFIWTNYYSETEDVDITSINYLSTFALERAGVALPAYNQFLADMSQVIPAINSRGYYSLDKGRFIDITDAEGQEADWIEKYQCLQYNNMFDKKNKSKVFFPYLE